MKVIAFTKLPFTIDDLKRIYSLKDFKSYIVEKKIVLTKINFENFITDMCVSRWFIEENRHLCYIDSENIWHCILVTQKGRKDGILVMSDGEEFPKYAAYVSENNL